MREAKAYLFNENILLAKFTGRLAWGLGSDLVGGNYRSILLNQSMSGYSSDHSPLGVKNCREEKLKKKKSILKENLNP